jgi:hypothetical protein
MWFESTLKFLKLYLYVILQNFFSFLVFLKIDVGLVCLLPESERVPGSEGDLG